MNVALWILQAMLASAFLGAGYAKVTQSKEKLQLRMTFVEDYSAGGVKGIGVVELLGAAGVVLPWATGIARVLTPIAGLGLTIIMIGAIVTHLRRNEANHLGAPVGLLVLALAVTVGRFADL